MAFTSWRGVVGCIKPTMRPGSLEELIRMLPEGIGIVPLPGNQGGIDRGVQARRHAIRAAGRQARRSGLRPHPCRGRAPFMLLGYDGEAKLLGEWEKKYKVPIFTSGTNHVRALKALGVKRFVGATYFTGQINDLFAKYFTEAGFDVLGMEGVSGFVRRHRPDVVTRCLCSREKELPQASRCASRLSSGLRLGVLPVIDTLEQDLGVPVIHPYRRDAGKSSAACRFTSPSRAMAGCSPKWSPASQDISRRERVRQKWNPVWRPNARHGKTSSR